MRRLTDLEASALHWMTTVSGPVFAPNEAIAETIRALIAERAFVGITVTEDGLAALAAYDQQATEAGRLALAEQEKGR